MYTFAFSFEVIFVYAVVLYALLRIFLLEMLEPSNKSAQLTQTTVWITLRTAAFKIASFAYSRLVNWEVRIKTRLD